MVPIKIECECGQHYAFDVEPVNGRMPTRVACPTCGTDGTGVANDTIARHLGPPPSPVIRMVEAPTQMSATTATSTATIAAPPPPTIVPVETPILTPSAPRLSVTANTAPRAAHAPTPGRVDPRLGLVDKAQAEHEARAKAMWGDTKEQIVSYLMIQSFTVAEANELVTKLFKERTAEMRRRGISKIIRGIGLMCVPLIALMVFIFVFGVIPMNLFAITIMIGLYGLWLLVNGILMAVAPKSEGGDVANH